MVTLPNFDFDGPDWALRWPASLLVDELEQLKTKHELVGLVLAEAFSGTQPKDEWSALLAGGPAETYLFLKAIKDAASRGNFRLGGAARPRFSERQSGIEVRRSIDDAQFSKAMRLLIDRFENRGYFAQRTYFYCPDVVQDLPTLYDYLALQLGRVKSPFEADESLSVDLLLDSVEILHEIVARPRSWGRHDFGGCPGHPSQFSLSTGQALFRSEVNELLSGTQLGLELSGEGENRGLLVRVVPDGRSDLLSSARWQGHSHVSDIAHAAALFTRRGASREEKRSAVVALAGVLEAKRDRVKESLLRKDEGVLFRIANEFDVRHRTDVQRTDYREEFLDWFFWWYLATIELIDCLGGPEQPT